MPLNRRITPAAKSTPAADSTAETLPQSSSTNQRPTTNLSPSSPANLSSFTDWSISSKVAFIIGYSIILLGACFLGPMLAPLAPLLSRSAGGCRAPVPRGQSGIVEDSCTDTVMYHKPIRSTNSYILHEFAKLSHMSDRVPMGSKLPEGIALAVSAISKHLELDAVPEPMVSEFIYDNQAYWQGRIENLARWGITIPESAADLASQPQRFLSSNHVPDSRNLGYKSDYKLNISQESFENILLLTYLVGECDMNSSDFVLSKSQDNSYHRETYKLTWVDLDSSLPATEVCDYLPGGRSEILNRFQVAENTVSDRFFRLAKKAQRELPAIKAIITENMTTEAKNSGFDVKDENLPLIHEGIEKRARKLVSIIEKLKVSKATYKDLITKYSDEYLSQNARS